MLNRILIRGPDTIGSFVLATPFYRELRRNLPDSYIVLCIKPAVCELAKDCKYINKLFLYKPENIFKRKFFIDLLKQEKFSSVFLLSGSFESALISYLSGIKNRIGYGHDHRRILLTKEIPDNGNKNYIDYLLYMLELMNLKIENRDPELYFDLNFQSDLIKSLNFDNNKIIGLGLTALGEQSRSWPKEYAVRLIQELLKDNVYIFLFGTKKDISYYNYVTDNINNNRIINFSGKTSLTEFASIVRKCDLYISVATGGIHIASALGVKVLGFYCPGDEIGWSPNPRSLNVEIITKNTDCAPCTQHKMKYCKDNICIKSIKPEEVLEKVKNTLHIYKQGR